MLASGARAPLIASESSSATRWPASGSRKALGADRDQRRPGGEEFERVGAARDPAHADDRQADRCGDGPHLGNRDRPHRGAGEAAVAGGEPGRRGRGRSRSAFSVLISETASAPPSSAATATAAGSATFGVSLTISGFAVRGRSASSSAAVSSGCSPTISPEWTLGQDTFSSIAATSSRPPTASTSRSNSSWLVPITETISGTGSSASCGRSSARNPSRPLFGSPIELIIPAGVSQIRCGSLPTRGSGVIVFETKAENGNSSSRASPYTRRAAMASRFTARRIDHGAGRVRFRRSQAPPNHAANHRAVDAEPHVAAIRLRNGAAEAGAVAAGHRRLHRQLAGDAALGAERPHRLQHRRRAAGVDDGAGGVVAVEHRREQVGHVALVAGVAVLAGEAHLAAGEEVVEAARVGLVAEAEQDAGGDVALGEAAAQQRQRGDADAAADQDRAGGAGRQLARLGEGVAERAVDPDLSPRLQLAEPVGAGADPLDQEVEPHPARGRPGLGDRDRPWQERPLPPSAQWRSRRRACRTGPAAGSGPSPSSREKTR